MLLAALVTAAPPARPAPERAEDLPELFVPAERCQPCHNGLVTPTGHDVSIGIDWRASVMAHAARDPYWQAAVRRELTDHPRARALIEDECSACHMPMSNYRARAAGGRGRVFAHLGPEPTEADLLAREGVSCSVCHQIEPARLGEPESFVGHFVIDIERPPGQRRAYGPYEVEPGLATIMRSATGLQPAQAPHIGSSEVCATCHTLYTTTLGPDGEVIGRLPEQVPYLEWLASDYRDVQSCQGCHMPSVEQPVPITSVLGEPREDVSLHVFRGGNALLLRMLARFRVLLGVEALPGELGRAAEQTATHLRDHSAGISLQAARGDDGHVTAVVSVINLAGHKLPTAYPSRRAWIHLRVTSGGGEVLFESGALAPDGAITGNDNDADPRAYEPHHDEIREPGQVQIYESIMVTPDGTVTTGLLSAIRFVKDNRLLPQGFVQASAGPDIAVRGRARDDADFTGGGDTVRYVVDTGGAAGPLRVDARLWYQPVAYRWAHNLEAYPAPETQRFVALYASMAPASAVLLAEASAELE